MIFSSLFFIFIFLPLVLVAYYLVPRKFKNLCLVLFSLVFMRGAEPIYVLLMIFTILVELCLRPLRCPVYRPAREGQAVYHHQHCHQPGTAGLL